MKWTWIIENFRLITTLRSTAMTKTCETAKMRKVKQSSKHDIQTFLELASEWNTWWVSKSSAY